MARAKRAFEIVYRPATVRHLDAIEAKYLGLIRTTIEEPLSHEPFDETTSRKPLFRQSPFGENIGGETSSSGRTRAFQPTAHKDGHGNDGYDRLTVASNDDGFTAARGAPRLKASG